MKRAALYVRVSTDGQTIENQIIALREVAERRGWQVIEPPYKDEGISGTKGRDRRPGFDRLCKEATKRRFDIVMAWSIDRIGRSVKDVATFMAEMGELGIAQYYDKQSIDTGTAYGKAMLQMAAVFAELEVEIIRDRINAGLARARATGTRSGKAIGRPTIDADTEAAIRTALAAGYGILKAAKACGVSNGPVKRIKAEMTHAE